MEVVRPFALIAASVLKEVTGTLTEASKSWRVDWGLEQVDLEITCSRAWEQIPRQTGLQWQHCYSRQGKTIWFALPSDFVKYVQRQMFPPDPRHVVHIKNTLSIAAEGAEKVELAFRDRIAGVLGLAEDARGTKNSPGAVDENFKYASGAVVVKIKFGDQTISCLLNHESVVSIAASSILRMPGKGLDVKLDVALKRVPISLPVEIGRAEVDVRSLMSLALGDVIRLDALIDKPLSIRGPGGKVLFRGHLGTLEKTIAIEVTRNESAGSIF